jgi:sigma-E factor negative regulatory protein RseA
MAGKMNKEALEHLSSLMDGEINRDTGRFLIRRLGSDGEMRATWARYHVVRDCLRHQEGSVLGSSFSDRVRQALEQEDSIAAGPKFAARWLKPVAGVAIAASVALMAIVTVGPGPGAVNETAVDSLAGSQAESFVSPNSALSPVPVTQQASTAGLSSDRERMNSYLLRHYQVAGSTGGKGFVTLVPIVITRNTVDNAQDEQARAEPQELKNGADSASQ